jgi:DnaJ-class molecular chaperone
MIEVPMQIDGDATGASACLADEIAIDFPSLITIRDRMRRAFFGGEPTASRHVAEIRLTIREALSGAKVPIHVPVFTTCAPCGGRGEIWMDPCRACGGTGAFAARQAVRVTVPPGVRDGARFRFSVTPPSASPISVEVRIAIT